MNRFLDSLEDFAEGLRMLQVNSTDRRLFASGERLHEMVVEFRKDIAETKRDLAKVRVPGEDAYEVDVEH